MIHTHTFLYVDVQLVMYRIFHSIANAHKTDIGHNQYIHFEFQVYTYNFFLSSAQRACGLAEKHLYTSETEYEAYYYDYDCCCCFIYSACFVLYLYLWPFKYSWLSHGCLICSHCLYASSEKKNKRRCHDCRMLPKRQTIETLFENACRIQYIIYICMYQIVYSHRIFEHFSIVCCCKRFCRLFIVVDAVVVSFVVPFCLHRPLSFYCFLHSCSSCNFFSRCFIESDLKFSACLFAVCRITATRTYIIRLRLFFQRMRDKYCHQMQ